MSPTAARSKAERRKRKARAWAGLAAVAMATVPSLAPRDSVVIGCCAALVFAMSIPAALNGYKYRARWYMFVPLLLLHSLIVVVGCWFIWPSVKVSPQRLKFRGDAESFNLSVFNDTDSDRYLVNLPIQVADGLEPLISAKYESTSHEGPLQNAYDYCYGKNGKEYLVVNFTHLLPGEKHLFTISYRGGKPFSAEIRRTRSSSEPSGFSGVKGTVGVTGDYRVCKYVLTPIKEK